MDRAFSLLVLGSALTLSVALSAHGAVRPLEVAPVDWAKLGDDARAVAEAAGQSLLKSQQMCGSLLDCSWIGAPP